MLNYYPRFYTKRVETTRPITEILKNISKGKFVTLAEKRLADIYNNNQRISKSKKK